MSRVLCGPYKSPKCFERKYGPGCIFLQPGRGESKKCEVCFKSKDRPSLTQTWHFKEKSMNLTNRI